MNKKTEELNRIVTFLLGMFVLLALTAVFSYSWLKINSTLTVWPFDKKGNYLIIFFYFVLQYLLSRIYGAFQVEFNRLWDLIYSQALTTVIVDVLMYVVMSLVARELLKPGIVLLMFIVQLAVIIVWAVISKNIIKKMYPPKDLLIVYSDKYKTNIIQKMKLRDDQFRITEALKVEEDLDKFEESLSKHDGAVICDITGSIRNDLLKICYENGKLVYVMPKITDILIEAGEDVHIFDTPLILCRNIGLTFEEKIAKRILDIIVAFIGLVVMSPFMLVTAIAIKLYDGGPVFFKQDRVTKDGKVFKIIKFRSMREDADRDGKAHSATKDDERITPVGKVIRACRMDEFPQIINILKGDMSIVGPRPEIIENVEKYSKEIPEFKYRHKVKAGLTGYAQIYGKYNTTAYDKLKLDLHYIENYSIRTDIRLILMTVKVLFMRESTEAFEES